MSTWMHFCVLFFSLLAMAQRYLYSCICGILTTALGDGIIFLKSLHLLVLMMISKWLCKPNNVGRAGWHFLWLTHIMTWDSYPSEYTYLFEIHLRSKYGPINGFFFITWRVMKHFSTEYEWFPFTCIICVALQFYGGKSSQFSLDCLFAVSQ